jgi:hypothetical protein
MSNSDDPGSDHNAVRIELVTTPNQFAQAMAIRAIAYMADEFTRLPYDDACDGNDFQATHVLVYLRDEPIGAARVRWFRDFAKLERTGFRPEYRDPRYLKRAAAFIFDHVARKGYSRVITHAQPRYAVIWRRILGMKLVSKPAAAYLEGEYVELEKDLVVPSNVITAQTSIQTLFRTEGRWDEPNKYESRL